MSCPTCDHTMQGIGKLETGERLFWCPRCGTIRRVRHERTGWIAGQSTVDDVPKLPGRVRELLDYFETFETPIRNPLHATAWTLGLYESCMIDPDYPNTETSA